jgi:hypothetical protein
MISFVCIVCSQDRAKGCTLIAEDGERLPLICVRKDNRKVITCDWMEVPDTKTMDFTY